MNIHNYASAADRIEQLEADLKHANAAHAKTFAKLVQISQIADILFDDLQQADTDCRFCTHAVQPAPCETADCDCSICKENCICKNCRDNSNWQWKGRRKDLAPIEKETDTITTSLMGIR